MYKRQEQTDFTLPTTAADAHYLFYMGMVFKGIAPMDEPLTSTEKTFSERVIFPSYKYGTDVTPGLILLNDGSVNVEGNPYVFFNRSLNGDPDNLPLAIDGNNGMNGYSVGASGSSYHTTKEVFIQPVTSLAQLQHSLSLNICLLYTSPSPRDA